MIDPSITRLIDPSITKLIDPSIIELPDPSIPRLFDPPDHPIAPPGPMRDPRRRVATRPRTGTSESRHPLKHPRTKAEVAAIARLRRICMALPEVSEKIAWGEPTWRAGKIFAQLDTHHHGAAHVAVWLPARPGVQEDLVAEDPTRFFRPPYVGVKGWIGVRIDAKPDWKVVASLVADAYREVAPPRLRAALETGKRQRPRGLRAGWAESLDAGRKRAPRRRDPARP